ncbi:MAG: class I SAM-dependent methyltransferase [Oscillospiraceae bacterium]
MIKLSNRLKLTADFVNECEHFVDVGTDHAYLPTFLIEINKAKRAIASDINPNPLKNAEQTIIESNLSDKIELRISDGLNNISENEADEIAMAGMGGLLISDIIERTEWLKNPKKHLVLQPMTHSENVRQALTKNGFRIDCEKTTAEGKRLYLVISATYDGIIRTFPKHYYYVGRLNLSKDETDIKYVEKIKDRLLKQKQALENSHQETGDLPEIIRGINND